MTSQKRPDWWGPHTLQDDQTVAWSLGPLQLWVRPDTYEYRTAAVQSTDPFLRAESFDPAAPPAPPDASVRRFAFSDARRALVLSPCLPDRHIVVRPDQAFVVLAHATARIFVSAPLWIGLGHEGDAQPMAEVPTLQLSNTWYGGPTRPNGLAYALRTRARLELDDAVWHPFRVLTPVVIHNRTADHLPVERVRIPMRELALFFGNLGFWTPTVKIVRHDQDGQVDVEFAETPPSEECTGERVLGPRDEGDRSRLRRALEALLS